jgi:hypothetical protein
MRLGRRRVSQRGQHDDDRLLQEQLLRIYSQTHAEVVELRRLPRRRRRAA